LIHVSHYLIVETMSNRISLESRFDSIGQQRQPSLTITIHAKYSCCIRPKLDCLKHEHVIVKPFNPAARHVMLTRDPFKERRIVFRDNEREACK